MGKSESPPFCQTTGHLLPRTRQGWSTGEDLGSRLGRKQWGQKQSYSYSAASRGLPAKYHSVLKVPGSCTFGQPGPKAESSGWLLGEKPSCVSKWWGLKDCQSLAESCSQGYSLPEKRPQPSHEGSPASLGTSPCLTLILGLCRERNTTTPGSVDLSKIWGKR